jgi:hypothetical protein
MRSPRTTLVLAALLLLGLLGLWALERLGVPTEAQRRERSGRVLPDLIAVKEDEISRVEIAREGESLRFERRGRNAWQLTAPLDVAADPAILETLIRNLKGLRPSADAGTIRGPADGYGLGPPRAVVRLWRTPSSSRSAEDPPLAALELGRSLRDQTFVRPVGAPGIEVVESRLLATIERSKEEFREKNLLPLATFQVNRLEIHRGQAELTVERAPSGRWRLTAPVVCPANGPKVESVLAACASIRVADAPNGFVADDVKDFSPYGLDRPVATLALGSVARPDAPLILAVGKPVPDHPDQVYVRRTDQDDVVRVSSRFLGEIPDRNTALRSQQVAEIAPPLVSRIELTALGTTFTLHRDRDSWELRSPVMEKADRASVRALLGQLDALQTSEFLDAAKVPRPELDPPVMTVKVWQHDPDRGSTRGPGGDAADVDRSSSLVLNLRIGRHDVLKKTVYGRLEGDDVILALPDQVLDHLPGTRYAYRDRRVLAIGPEQVRRLTLERGDTVTVLEPDDSASGPNRWRMTRPVSAPAEVPTVTQLLAGLSDLRAEDFAGEAADDPIPFGLDRPVLTIRWESGPAGSAGPPVEGAPDRGTTGRDRPAEGWLKIGRQVPGRPGSVYASAAGRPFVFTLPSSVLDVFAAEFHDTRVLSFAPEAVRRLVLRVPGRTFGFARRLPPRGEPSDWRPEPGTDARGVDLSRFNALIVQLAQLRATRFLQYAGPISPATGLLRPRLTVEVHWGDGPPSLLRLGSDSGRMLPAASGDADSGPVFLLPAAAWEALIGALGAPDALPDEVFNP